jgi:hypothetical protein
LKTGKAVGEESGRNSLHWVFVSEDSDVCLFLRSLHCEALVFNKCGSVYVAPFWHPSPLPSRPNTTAYSTYIIVFPSVKDSAFANSMQIAEIQLGDALGAPLLAPADAILGGELDPVPVTLQRFTID